MPRGTEIPLQTVISAKQRQTTPSISTKIIFSFLLAFPAGARFKKVKKFWKVYWRWSMLQLSKQKTACCRLKGVWPSRVITTPLWGVARIKQQYQLFPVWDLLCDIEPASRHTAEALLRKTTLLKMGVHFNIDRAFNLKMNRREYTPLYGKEKNKKFQSSKVFQSFPFFPF